MGSEVKKFLPLSWTCGKCEGSSIYIQKEKEKNWSISSQSQLSLNGLVVPVVGRGIKGGGCWR